jgi:hypothetical protein
MVHASKNLIFLEQSLAGSGERLPSIFNQAAIQSSENVANDWAKKK